MNEFRILPLMIYFWILAAFIINYSSEAKKIRKNHHNKKCMTYKNPSNNIESRQNAHKRKKRLINGWEGDIRQMPWMVSLSTTYQQNGQNRSGFATGSLISPRHVLTCGHCIRYDRLNENSTITVVYGSANKNEGNRIVLNKTAAHVHPNYTSFAISPNLYTTNDLAIVHLGQDIEFDETVHSICLVCLGKNNTSNPEGNVTIAGWGSTVDPCAKLPLIYPDVFRWDIVRTHPCLNPNSVTIDKVCHEANLQHTISGGDSGGPVLAIRNSKNDGRQYQIGVQGGNICNPSSQRENSFDKIDGEWVKKLTGVKCKNYNEE